MHNKKHHIVRKTIIVISAFALGVVGTVIAAATYDANIQARATKMFATIKSNASTLAEADQKAYYTLVRLNIESLIQVLTSVNSSLDIELGTTSDLDDGSIVDQITSTETTGTGVPNTGANTTGSTSTIGKVTISVTGGTNMLCGDPTRNDYMSWSDVNWQSNRTNVIDKAYCNSKGNNGVGYVWNVCNGVITNKKTVDSLVGGEIFSCPSTSVQTSGSATSVSSSVQTSPSTNGCNWQYHSVVGPVGALTVNPSTTACTPNTNGTKAVEVTGNRQTVATCNCATTSSSVPTPGTVASVKQVTLNVPSGMVACGNPDKNDYTTYSTVGGKVIIQKDYCIAKGGYVWVMCGGKATNIKNVDTVQDGATFTCPTVSTTTTTATNSCNWQYHSVVGPVGDMTVNPSTTACTPNTNGTKAVEISGNKQTVATCTCSSTTATPGTASTSTTSSPNTISCAGTAPVGNGVIKSTSVVGMVGSDTWNYVANTKGTSTDLGQSCQWTCAPGYIRLENNCVSGGSISSLVISPTSGVFSMTDKNTITATVTGLTKENTLVCNEVLAHPAYPSAISPAGYCSNPANFVPFSGNEDWVYVDGKWMGNVKYNAAIYGAAGIKVRGYWKNKATGAVVTYDLSVIAGSNNTSISTASQEYRWSCIVPGPVVVDTSNFSCNSSNVGKSQTIGGYSCNCTGPTPTPGTVASVKQVTLNVPSGMVACGNPDKNDYTTYSTVGGKVIIQKDYCIAKGGYVWVMCGGKATNIKNVDTVQDGATFTCPTVSTTTTTATNSCNWQYHSVVGPVGDMTVNPSTTACTPNTNGTKAVEISGNKQTVATCTCSSTTATPGTASTSTTSSPNTISCAGTAPVGNGVIKSTSVVGMVGSDTWNYVANTKGTSTDLGQSCQWTCAPGYMRIGNTCSISAPTTIWTDRSLSTQKTLFKLGETLYGYIQGGDPTNTWACLDGPSDVDDCDSPSKFRKLTVATNGVPDGWQINPTTNRIELREGLYIDPVFPLGIYTGYARTGQYGSDTTTMEILLVKQ